MTALRPWVMLPTKWIEDKGLKGFRWAKQQGSAHLAGLMTLAVISHHTDRDTGIAKLTYDDLTAKASLSRASVSRGLDILINKGLIDLHPAGRSTYGLVGFDKSAGWSKFPAKGLYHHGAAVGLSSFTLRSPAELDAMKLYFLFAARRDRTTGMALLTYDKIDEYAGVSGRRIKLALNVLSAGGLIHIDHIPRQYGEPGVANGYRLAHLDPYRHMGTTGRHLDPADLAYAFTEVG